MAVGVFPPANANGQFAVHRFACPEVLAAAITNTASYDVPVLQSRFLDDVPGLSFAVGAVHATAANVTMAARYTAVSTTR